MRFARFVLLLGAAGLLSCETTPRWPEGTPETVENYKKVTEDRLGPLWYHEVNNNLSAAQVGVVKLTFQIPAAGGQVTNLKVVSNTGGALDESFAVTAVNRLRAPPIPLSLLQSKHEDHLNFEESFTVFADPTESPTPIPTRRERIGA